MIVVGKNPSGRQNCIVSRRKARRVIGELLGQYEQFSRGELGRSSIGDLHSFFGEDNTGNRRHWQKNLRNFSKEDKIGLQELLVKISQPSEIVRART